MHKLRKPTTIELGLIQHCIRISNYAISELWQEEMLVQTMDDGGMGSLLLFLGNSPTDDRHFGKEIAEFSFEDTDGVLVSVALNIDNFGNLFELDVWKVNNSPTLAFPALWIE
jgi:hypothetical protein